MKILIVRTGAMGDVVHAMHAVAGVRNALPDAEIGWAIEPQWEPLLRSHAGTMPLVHHIHRAETKRWNRAPFSLSTAKNILQLRKELRAEKYDLCIDLQGSIRSAIIGRMANARHFVGSATPRESAARLLYTQQTAVAQPHVIAQGAEILSAALAHEIKPLQHLPFPVDESEKQWCNTLLGDDTRPVAFLAPRAGWGAKQWPPERFGAVASQLAQRGWRVLVNAIPANAQHGGDIIAASVVTASEGSAATVECTLPQLIALTQKLNLFIGGDTGPMHLAAASGVPCVAIFGPTDPKRTGPWNTKEGRTNARVLRDASSVTDHRRHTAPESGLLRITVEDVLRAAREVTERTDA